MGWVGRVLVARQAARQAAFSVVCRVTPHANTSNTACVGRVLQGPAVWALRAQTDKLEYAREMRRVLEATPNLSIREVGVMQGQG